ncbi:MAG TPA: helix-turn-helix transcriptional regulator [Cellvibrio sp.]
MRIFIDMKGYDPVQLKKQFGKRLQQCRVASKLTQEQLAERVGVTIESISNMERGIHGPGFDTLEKITKALGIPAKVLFEFDE